MVHGLGVQAAVVLGLVPILRNGSIEVGQERLLDFPIVHFRANTEFKILLRD